MKYHLERTVRLAESDYPSLYSRALQEFDQMGEPIGPQLLPWVGQCFFEAVEFGYRTTFAREYNYQEEDKRPISATEKSIFGRLYPGYGGEDFERGPVFSLFGTDRFLSFLNLNVFPLADDDSTEVCSYWAIPSYSYEYQYREKTEEDFVGFEIYLKRERFDALSQAIRLQQVARMNLRLRGVSGIYAEWDPEDYATFVKILHGSELVEDPLGLAWEPPTASHLDDVLEFDLTWYTHRNLPLMKEYRITEEEVLNRINPENRYDDQEGLVNEQQLEDIESPNIEFQELQPPVVKDEAYKMLRSIKVALWLLLALAIADFLNLTW